jgi:hypothetical protein
MPEAPRDASGSTSIVEGAVEVVLDEEAGERYLSPPAIGRSARSGRLKANGPAKSTQKIEAH